MYLNDLNDYAISKEYLNETNIRYFKIFDLFGNKDVELHFDDKVNIYIGENGVGKTTIIKCFYYILTLNFESLLSIDFKKIQIGFSDIKNPLELCKTDLVANYKSEDHTISQRNRSLIKSYLKYDYKVADGYHDLAFLKILKNIAGENNISIRDAKYLVKKYLMEENFDNIHSMRGDKAKFELFARRLEKRLVNKIIYLPTFRRIEDNFEELHIEQNLITQESLIRFGMADVKRYTEKILDKIRELSVLGFNEMASYLLNIYSENNVAGKSKILNGDAETIKIILDRVNSKINISTRKKIIQLIETGEITNGSYNYLIDILNGLLVYYQKQRPYDEKIFLFANACNKYLYDKKFYYNPNKVVLNLISDTGKDMDMNCLSSGEKQIVSLFSRLYLDDIKDNIIIIDEPELSLSILWQRMILPDVINSKACALLVVITHSPFIFDNEFDKYAKEIMVKKHEGR